MTKRDNRIYGFCLMVILSCLVSLSNTLTHGLSIPAFQILFFKSGIGLIILFPFILTKTKSFFFQFTRGFSGMLGNFFWIYSLQNLPLAHCTALSLLSSFFIPMGAYLFFNEKSSLWTIISLILSVLGASFIVTFSSASLSWLILLPVGSALCFSFSSLLIKRISIIDSSWTTLLYLLLIMTLLSFPLAYRHWVSMTNFEYGILLMISSVYVITQWIMIEAYTYINAWFLSPLKFLKFPIAICVGFFMFHETIPLSTILGSSLILIAFILLAKGKQERSYQGDIRSKPYVVGYN